MLSSKKSTWRIKVIFNIWPWLYFVSFPETRRVSGRKRGPQAASTAATEEESEEVDVEKDFSSETIEPKTETPTKAKRGRKAAAAAVTPKQPQQPQQQQSDEVEQNVTPTRSGRVVRQAAGANSAAKKKGIPGNFTI